MVVVERLAGRPEFRPGAYEIEALGYAVREYSFAGVAHAYEAGATAEVLPVRPEAYKSRLVTVFPKDPARFNGTVIVEWMNVTGGLDVPVLWINAHREIVRRGYGYVAVSAQKVGIDGGPSIGSGQFPPLKQQNPARYGDLLHPGDAYAHDIFSDVAHALRGPLAGEFPGIGHLLAAGESQSAMYLATYVNAVDGQAGCYDGFFIHSRPAVAAPLENIFMFEAPEAWRRQAVTLRNDLRVPVLQLVTETDLLGLGALEGFAAARQPDGAHLRTWEVAGSAHADNYLFGVGMIDVPGAPIEELAKAWAPLSNLRGQEMARPPNNGPQHHYVVEAALRRLDEWVRTGEAPPRAEALRLAEGRPWRLQADEHGNALGGVRSPWVDVPIAQLTGDTLLSGNEMVGMVAPFTAAQIALLYPGGKAEYLQKFAASLDDAIAGGFILADDREEILALAAAGFPSGG